MNSMIIRRMNITFSRREFLYVAGASTLSLRSAFAADTYVVADSAAGKGRGVEVEGIKIFKGVPCGANTTGRNRFMPPAPVAKWTGVGDGLQFGASRSQGGPAAGRAGHHPPRGA